MAKRKQRLQIKIVLDTNAIWTGGESYLLKKEISELVNANRGDMHLMVEWILPEVVVHERLYQMQKEAAALLPALATLERVIGHPLNITEEILSKRITEAVDRQVKEHSLLIHSASYDRIDWLRLVGDAVNRRPPFEPKSEKGFRDAIIAETFLQIAEASPEQPQRCRIVFLSNDGLLSEAVRRKLANRANIQIFSSVDELKGLINTLMSAVPEDYVARLQAKAKEYFLKDVSDETGLFYDLKIQDVVRRECKEQLSAKPENADRRSNGNWNLTAPRFVKKESQRVFWASRFAIEAKAFKDVPRQLPAYDIFGSNLFANEKSSSQGLVQLHGEFTKPVNVIGGFIPQGSGGVISTQFPVSVLNSPFLDERLVATGKTIVDVNWSISVSIKGGFSKPAIESIQFIETIWETVD